MSTAQDRLRDMVDRNVDDLTFECHCGDYGCPGRARPARRDPRVVMATLAEAVIALIDGWDPELAHAIAEYARENASSAYAADCQMSTVVSRVHEGIAVNR